MIKLRDYQSKAVDSVFDSWQKNDGTMVVLPTGGGKTVVGFSVVDRALQITPTARALWYAHTTELVSQPYNCVKNLFPHLLSKTGIVQAGRNEPHRQIIIGTIQTIGNKRGVRIDEILLYGKIDYLIIDEAHHVAAKQHLSFVDKLRQVNPNLKILGISATPSRADKKLLTSVFTHEAFNISIRRLIDEGYLVEPVFQGIKTKVDLKSVKVNGSGGKRDYKMDELVSAFETNDTFELVVKTHLENCGHKPTIAFTVSVNGAKKLAEMMNNRGIKAVAVYGDMSKEDRKAALDGMRSGKYTFLSNCLVLTEGFDLPILECVHMVRPTKSDALYIQCIGRILRLSPETGKTCAFVYDYLPLNDRNFDQRMQMYKKPKRSRASPELPPERGASDPKPKSTGETEIILLDYFNRKQEAWLDDPEGWRCIQLGKGYDHKKHRMVERGLALSPDGTELWITWRTCGDKRLGTRGDRWAEAHLLAQGDVTKNLTLIDSFVTQYGDKIIMNRAAAWRNKQPSESLKRWGMSEKVYVEGMKQGELSDAIGKKIIMGAVERAMKKMGQPKQDSLELVNY